MRSLVGSGETTAERGQGNQPQEEPRAHIQRSPPQQQQPSASPSSSSLPLAAAPRPPLAVARAYRPLVAVGGSAAHTGEGSASESNSSNNSRASANTSATASIEGVENSVHTVHVQVPVTVAVHPSSTNNINMSLQLNISATTTTTTTTTTAASATKDILAPVPSTFTSTASAVVVPAPAPLPPAPLPVPPPSSSSSSPRRKRKGYSKKSNSSKEKDSIERQPTSSSAAALGIVGAAHAASAAAAASGAAPPPLPPPAPLARPMSSPFEKLNTLKMLLDAGHLTQDEYHERKTQIINEMTGTSTERIKKPSPKKRLVLQPIMKTVVPHQPPEFARIPKERAEKLSFDVDTLEWQATSTRIKLDLIPFATGQLRNAYFIQEFCTASSSSESMATNEPELLVAKFSIRDAEPSSYLSDVEMQAVCAHYAALYNEHVPPLRVYYARSWLLKLKDRGNEVVCSVEEYLPGAYVKYSNNNGYVGKETSTTEERERNTPHAFSHFTFVASDYRLMVVDIQGVDDSYTDPQIHTADGRGFGAGNLGTFGMEKFLESHRCNEVCRWLGLKSINKEYKPGGTAAPLYQMPFGGHIKKSTSRITEERNTFSRSVTVSEAFGGNARWNEDEEDGGRDGGEGNGGEEEEEAAGGKRRNKRQLANKEEEEEAAVSVSTSATTGGSSSFLYGQFLLPAASHQLHVHASSPTRRVPLSGNINSGVGGHTAAGGRRSGRRGRDDEDEPSMVWQVLKRLLCCCF